ncbi:hypothetical protein [Sorangium sp. So ce1099]|uniref:hypothetical protein n=1 Tax=Sorangium sp. So ce1099 TaxID=3133331 RepID=UPI003F5DFF10
MDLDAFVASAARRALLGAALTLALGAAPGLPGAREAAAATPLAWVAPDSARVVSWSDGRPQGAPAPAGTRAAPAAADPTAPVALTAGQLLLVPVEPGDRLEVRGDVAGIGLGSGVGESPDVITWMPLPPLEAGARDVAVPAWSSARFLAVRAAVPRGAERASVAVRVAARESAPLAWYRLDEDVAAWLGGRAPAPATAPGEAGALLRWVDAARAALSAPGSGGAASARGSAGAPSAPGSGGAASKQGNAGASPAPAAARLEPAAAAWLTARYLEESLLLRPLVEPYFVARDVDVRGGREGPDLPAVERASPWRSLGAGARLALRAPGADVLRIALRPRAFGATRVVVRAGGAVVRELAWRTGPRLADAARWREPRWIRVPLPVDSREATVDVVEGEIAVTASGYRQRAGVAELVAPQRDRAALLDRAAQRDRAGAGAGDRAPAHAEAPRLLAAADRAAAAEPARTALAFAALPAVSPPLRALILAESVRWAPSPGVAFARAARAYAAAQGGAGSSAAPLQRAALARLAAAHADPGAATAPWAAPGGAAPAGAAPGGAAPPRDVAGGRAHPDDVAAVSALGAALSPAIDGRRPVGAPLAERYALGHGDIESAAPLARTAWAREAPWDALEIPEGVTAWSSIAPPRDAPPPAAGSAAPRDAADALCEVNAESGLRWTLLDRPRAEFAVEAPPGSHARVLLRSASAEVVPESSVLIDGTPAAVHGGAGLTSVVAVAPGARTFERRAGAPPVLARIPRSGRAACASLREIMQWAWVDGAVTFALPDPERATVARVVLAPAAVLGEAAAAPQAPGGAARASRSPGAPSAGAPSAARVLRVSAGAAVHEAWVSAGATGSIEIPVPAGARELRVETAAPALLRAAVRLHPPPPSAPRVVTPARPPSGAPVDGTLDQIRSATRALRAAPAPARAALRAQRAAALDSLGFPALAALDSAADDDPWDAGQLPGASSAGAPPSTVFSLPPGSPPAVPLGLPARVPPLPLPADRAPLASARAARIAGDPRRGVALLAGPAADSAGADALLLGLLAERSGDARIAADAFTRVGLAQRSAAALARAANLATDVAASAAKPDRLLTLRALALAELAVQTAAREAAGGDQGAAPAAPASSAPAAPGSVSSSGSGSTPAGSAPAGSTPAGSAPAGSTPAGSAPAGSTPAGSALPLQLPPAALARLAPVTGWDVPPRADATAGSATLEIRARADRDLPLRVRVRRALVDAPEAALLITDGARAEFRLDRAAPGAIVLDGTCRALDRDETPCAFSVALDGVPVACSAAAAPMTDRCVVQVPRGSHRVEVRPPADQSVLGWIRATAAGAAQPFAGRVLSTWHDIDPARPLELAFAGPTVVRIRAHAAYECAASPRARAALANGDDPTCHPEVASATPAGVLRFSVSPLDGAPGAHGAGAGAANPGAASPGAASPGAASPGAASPGAPGAVEEGTIALDTTEDRAARRLGVTREPFFWLGGEVEARVAVLPEGPHVLRVASPGGRALLRVELAVATGAPRPRVPPPAPPPPAPGSPADELLRPAPPVGEDPDAGPLSIGAYARLVDSELTEEDLRLPLRFLELGVDVHRELIERRAWFSAAGFGRLRDGPESFGAEARFDLSSSGWVPGAALSGRVVFQPGAGDAAVGGRASASAFWSIPLGGELTLSPWAGFTLLAVDESLRGVSGADKDIFTPYADEHRTQASLGARLRHRPFVDALVTAGTSLRLSPVPSTLDRIDATLDLDLLPGRGLWPWIQLGWLASYRPENETRDEAFLRDAFTAGLTFWSWLSRGHRVSLGAEGTFLFDIPSPAETSPRLSALLFARYDYTAGRGLRDFPPQSTPFRDRQEEGSGIIERERPAVEPSWEDP